MPVCHLTAPGVTTRLVTRLAVLGLAGALLAVPAGAQGRGRRPAVPGSLVDVADDDSMFVIKSQHKRLTFSQDIKRIAVGDAEILSAELITSREVLALGRQTGTTSLIVWFANGTTREITFSVRRDIALLEKALKNVHPNIDVESAPDRDAIVLIGRVPNQLVSQAAEAVARNYLDASAVRRGADTLVLGIYPSSLWTRRSRTPFTAKAS